MARALVAAGFFGLVAVALSGCDDTPKAAPPSASAAGENLPAMPSGVAPPLPAPGEMQSAPERAVVSAPPPPPPPAPRCPKDMVLVPSALCVDRYEATLVEQKTNQALSPYYPPEKTKALYIEKIFVDKVGTGTDLEKATPMPKLPALERSSFEPVAVSKKGVVPQAYASGKDAAKACANAGKRLCKEEEWKRACRGEADQDFPYGPSYKPGECNVFREAHPGVLLWEDPTINHLDPRFNLMKGPKGILLRKTGETPACASRWGDDAIYDMVGNVDEWVDDPDGTFVGGFYARSNKAGCQARITNHVYSYADYSTGVRCCKDAELPGPRAVPPPSE